MIRPPSVLIVAAVLGSFAVACGAPSSRAVPSTPPPSVAVSTSTFGPIAPPPAEVLDATVVYFDPDGTDRQRDLPPPGVIADEPALEAFRQRFVDGDPGLGDDASMALEGGRVLIGAAVSSGCFPAGGAQLAFTAVDVRLLPTGLSPDDPDVDCARAITSIALVAIEATELPAGLPVRGT